MKQHIVVRCGAIHDVTVVIAAPPAVTHLAY